MITLRLGVTGHRRLDHPERIERAVREVLATLDQRCHGRPHRLRVLSSLAEGADRLVARAVLRWRPARHPRRPSHPGLRTSHPCPRTPPRPDLPAPELLAVLPMAEERYLATFSASGREASVSEYLALKEQAFEVYQVPEAADRHEAYERAGRFVCDHCDVLLAVWDGKAAGGRGGTAEIVEYARSRNRPVIAIDARSGKVRESGAGDDRISQLRHWDEFLREAVDRPPLEEDVRSRWEQLQRHAGAAGLEARRVAPLETALLQSLAKASRLARRFQRRYFSAGEAAYVAAALAVAAAALGSLVLPGRILFVVEALLIALIALIAWPRRFRAWQRKWIEYRFLAERLRAMQFLFVAGVEPAPTEAPADLRLDWLPVGWTAIVLRETWDALGEHRDRGDDLWREHHVSSLARFLGGAWIEDQRRFYYETGRRHLDAHERLERWLKVILVATFVIALVHLALPAPAPAHPQPGAGAVAEGVSWEAALSVLAVTLPALASALAGIGVFRHFHRNAERYNSMSRLLDDIGRKLQEIAELPAAEQRPSLDLARLQLLASQAERAMAHEHEGWTVVYGVHLPGPG